MDVAGSYAYVAQEAQGLRVIDISDPVNAVEVGHYDTPNYSMGVIISGHYALLSESAGLRIVDITNPNAPSFVSSLDMPYAQALDCVVISGYAYVADGHNGVAMIDVTNLANPILADMYNTAGAAKGVAEANGLIYVADDYNGLLILEPHIINKTFLPLIIR